MIMGIPPFNSARPITPDSTLSAIISFRGVAVYVPLFLTQVLALQIAACRSPCIWRGGTEPKVFLQPRAQSSSNAGIGSYYMSLTRLPNTRIILQYLPVPHVVDSPASQKFHADPTLYMARGYVTPGYSTTTCPINFKR